jgi:hypothetical protein
LKALRKARNRVAERGYEKAARDRESNEHGKRRKGGELLSELKL